MIAITMIITIIRTRRSRRVNVWLARVGHVALHLCARPVWSGQAVLDVCTYGQHEQNTHTERQGWMEYSLDPRLDVLAKESFSEIPVRAQRKRGAVSSGSKFFKHHRFNRVRPPNRAACPKEGRLTHDNDHSLPSGREYLTVMVPNPETLFGTGPKTLTPGSPGNGSLLYPAEAPPEVSILWYMKL